MYNKWIDTVKIIIYVFLWSKVCLKQNYRLKQFSKKFVYWSAKLNLAIKNHMKWCSIRSQMWKKCIQSGCVCFCSSNLLIKIINLKNSFNQIKKKHLEIKSK